MRQAHEWIIGASADCDIVVTEPTVSGRHCRLSWQNGVYQLEDLGSTNGTFVDDVQVTGVRTVTRDDGITLGQSVPFPWSQIPATTANASAGQRPATGTTAHATAVQVADWPRHLPLILSTVALLAVVALGWMLLHRPGNGSAAADNVASATDNTRQPADSAGKTAAAAGTGDASPPPADPATAAPAPSPKQPRLKPDDPANALYCLVVGDVSGTQRYRLGTACAIDKHRLLTSGSVVYAADQLADRFPKLVALSADRAATLQVQSRTVQPEFAKAATEVTQLKQRLAALQGDGLSASAATGAAGENDVAAEIHQLHTRGLELANIMLVHDLAILEVSATLPFVLTVESTARPASSEPLTLLGLPVDNESLFLDGKSLLTLGRETASASAPATGGPDDARLYARCAAEQMRLNWAGAPILNRQNQVVAVYCRPSPSADPLAPPTKDLLEAAWADAGTSW